MSANWHRTARGRAWMSSHRKRRWRTRSKTIHRLPKYTIKQGRELFPENVVHPKTRGECREATRPCPFASCRHHLLLDIGAQGAIKLNFPDLEFDEIPETCSLDVADRGDATLEEVGEFMNLTRERIRQIENQAFDKLKRRLPFLRFP